MSDSDSDLDCLLKSFSTSDAENRHIIQIVKNLKDQNKSLSSKIAELEAENKKLKDERVMILQQYEQEEEYFFNFHVHEIVKCKQEMRKAAEEYVNQEEKLVKELHAKIDQLEKERANVHDDNSDPTQECELQELKDNIQQLKKEVHLKTVELNELKESNVTRTAIMEQEQERLFNQLWKKISILEDEKKAIKLALNEERRNSTGGMGNVIPSNLTDPLPSANSYSCDCESPCKRGDSFLNSPKNVKAMEDLRILSKDELCSYLSDLRKDYIAVQKLVASFDATELQRKLQNVPLRRKRFWTSMHKESSAVAGSLLSCSNSSVSESSASDCWEPSRN